MEWLRVLRHLAMPAWRLRQSLPRASMQAIETAIGASERTHGGQICFAVETALDLAPLARGQAARERALEVFAQLRVWDTEHNNGVLIYLLLADRDVEIVADRGIAARVPAAQWEAICQAMESAFRAGRFEQGALDGIRAVGELLARHYPERGADTLSNAPYLL
ncbi:MAG TPA: TPM domain-containing protein [Pseudomonadales bacterium]|nr:TPM domain-containing protein [Pseudomonadales bacterium]